MEVNWLLRQLDVSHLLGRNLTLEESRDLRRRRRDFQRKWHPDKTVDEADAISRTVLLQRFNAAWELLTPRLTPEPVPMEVPVSEGLRQSPPYARAQPYANPGSSSGPTQSPPRYPWEFRNTVGSSTGANPASSSGPSQSAHGPTRNTAEGATGHTSRNKMPTPGNDGRTASNDTRSARSPLRDHNVVTRTCCPLAPHCDKFDRKYGRKNEKKQLEYRYLFAAQHHCLRCMQYYCDQEDVNPHCKSENKNARDWAELYNKIIPRTLEVWLTNRGL